MTFDRSFVRGLGNGHHDDRIVSAVVDLARPMPASGVPGMLSHRARR